MARKKHPAVAKTHKIHISLFKGQLNFVHEPFDSGNPNDGPVVNVDRGDKVVFKGRTGPWVVLFTGPTPFSRVFFGGGKNDEDSDTVSSAAPRDTSYKYFVATVDEHGNVVTADPDIVVT